MSTGRPALDRLFEACPSETDVTPPPCPGAWQLTTRRTTYFFRDGCCVDATDRSDTSRDGELDGLRGMRLAGFLPLNAEALEPRWSPGCVAVLVRREPVLPPMTTFAVTSVCQVFALLPEIDRCA